MLGLNHTTYHRVKVRAHCFRPSHDMPPTQELQHNVMFPPSFKGYAAWC